MVFRFPFLNNFFSHISPFLFSAADTTIIDVKTKIIQQHIRDNVYRAMSSSRQINCDKPSISSDTCDDQENNAAEENIVLSISEGCPIFPRKKTKFVVTKDLLITHKFNQHGFKHQTTDIFLVDLQGIERITPAEYPMWYVWLYYFPPCGLCGGHRYKLGKRGIGLYIYGLTLGFFGIGWVYDFFTLLCCVDDLKIKSSISLVFKDAENLDFNMKLEKPKDGEKLVSILNTELSKVPEMSKSKYVGQYKHTQHQGLMDCCKNW